MLDGSAHTIYAKAYDGDDNVSSSKVITIYIYRFQPSELKAYFLTDERINLTWNDNSSLETGFVIEQSINNNNFSIIKTVSQDTDSTTIEGIFYADTTYFFRVYAITNTEKSDYSNIDSITVLIAKPTNLVAHQISVTSMGLNWIDNCNFELGYIVEKKESNGNFIEVASLPANSETFIDNSLDYTIENAYAVKAFTNHSYSDTASIYLNNLEAPVISNLIAPDKVEDGEYFLITLDVFDIDGSDDIDVVSFIEFYESNPNASGPHLMYDDGTNGDFAPNDGTYSTSYHFPFPVTLDGTYRWEFQAKDKEGHLSDVIIHFVIVDLWP